MSRAPERNASVSFDRLPSYVERELRAYLDCGILARGFARVRCPDCGFERLVNGPGKWPDGRTSVANAKEVTP